MGGECSTHGGEKYEYVISVGKIEGKKTVVRIIYRWEYIIKLNL